MEKSKPLQVIVIGGGQAGLAVGYHLAKRGISFTILDASARVGDAWRNRWDSLRVFTPARYCGLPGLPFPAPGDSFPSKDQVADYLALYASTFALPVCQASRVDSLRKNGGKFIVTSGARHFEAENVVVAMSNYQAPSIPELTNRLDPRITRLHSSQYRNPSQLQKGGVLIVGSGNSGADIAMELVRTHPVWLSGKESGHIPFPIDDFVGRNVLARLVRFVGHHVLTVSTPMGRRARPQLLGKAAPLIRVKPRDLVRAGVERVPRVIGIRDGRPELADGAVLDVSNVIWCTGFKAGFSWIDLPIFGVDGRPVHDRGVVRSSPGLYFVGLHFLFSMTSATLAGVGRDAERIAGEIANSIEMKRRRADRQVIGQGTAGTLVEHG